MLSILRAFTIPLPTTFSLTPVASKPDQGFFTQPRIHGSVHTNTTAESTGIQIVLHSLFTAPFLRRHHRSSRNLRFPLLLRRALNRFIF
jgi:hypothetical protein